MKAVFPTRAQRRAGGDRVRLPGSRTPFKAARAQEREIQAAMEKPEAERGAALMAIKPLRSRGHGGRNSFQPQAGNRSNTDRSKHSPKKSEQKRVQRGLLARIGHYLTSGE